MLKYLFTVLAALTAGVSMAFTPVVYTNSFERDGVTYVQRGGLGTKDYVVTNVSMPTITYPVTSVNSKTGDVILAASDVSALPDNYTSLTNNVNFRNAVSKVSPPVGLPEKWAFSNVTNSQGNSVSASDVNAIGIEDGFATTNFIFRNYNPISYYQSEVTLTNIGLYRYAREGFTTPKLTRRTLSEISSQGIFCNAIALGQDNSSLGNYDVYITRTGISNNKMPNNMDLKFPDEEGTFATQEYATNLFDESVKTSSVQYGYSPWTVWNPNGVVTNMAIWGEIWPIDGQWYWYYGCGGYRQPGNSNDVYLVLTDFPTGEDRYTARRMQYTKIGDCYVLGTNVQFNSNIENLQEYLSVGQSPRIYPSNYGYFMRIGRYWPQGGYVSRYEALSHDFAKGSVYMNTDLKTSKNVTVVQPERIVFTGKENKNLIDIIREEITNSTTEVFSYTSPYYAFTNTAGNVYHVTTMPSEIRSSYIDAVNYIVKTNDTYKMMPSDSEVYYHDVASSRGTTGLNTDALKAVATDYQSITNTVNAVKSEFYDENLGVNWTMKMVNGEMKLYATTNVNMSTL